MWNFRLDDRGSRGTLIFTGATASCRGNVTTSARGVRALSHCLAKEFGKQNIHICTTLLHDPPSITMTFLDFQVSRAVIDGGIATDRMYGKDANPDEILSPDAIAEVHPTSPICGVRIDP
ncbi:hypothetical protein BS47DRAFT_294317 [Hydnum rufescens UP504]|uniref:Uncharacterized protein n=1 Tax=Hydnum rufescens UP504 TaxID=1448309 RepID=A0A9P6B610_9AGAM|nr:hypothetical protein BS47DRAFT_294317 [Hydnum rufescens UP504]